MAVATLHWFGKALANALGGETAGEAVAIDYLTDTIKVALLDAAPDTDTAEFWADLSATEVTGTNWAAGGQTLASKTVGYTAGTNTVALDAADVSVATTTLTGVTHLAIYKDTGVAATSPLLGWGALDGPVSTSAGTFAITWAAAGILTAVAS